MKIVSFFLSFNDRSRRPIYFANNSMIYGYSKGTNLSANICQRGCAEEIRKCASWEFILNQCDSGINQCGVIAVLCRLRSRLIRTMSIR